MIPIIKPMIPRMNPIIAFSFVSSNMIPIMPKIIATQIISHPIIETRLAILGINKLIKETKPAITALKIIQTNPNVNAIEP